MAYLCSYAKEVTGIIHGRAFLLLVDLDGITIMRFAVCSRIFKLRHGAVFKTLSRASYVLSDGGNYKNGS